MEKYNFSSSTYLPDPPVVPAAGTAQVLVPPVVSSASGSSCARDLDYALTLSTVEVAQVSEQPALLPSDVGSALGSAVQADDIVVPAVRKTQRCLVT